MTWSVGLRAPDWREMATAWCDHAIAERLPRARYRDQDLTPPRHRGEIPGVVLAEIRERIETALLGADDDDFASWFGAYVSEPKEHLQPLPPEDVLSPKACAKPSGLPAPSTGGRTAPVHPDRRRGPAPVRKWGDPSAPRGLSRFHRSDYRAPRPGLRADRTLARQPGLSGSALYPLQSGTL